MPKQVLRTTDGLILPVSDSTKKESKNKTLAEQIEREALRAYAEFAEKANKLGESQVRAASPK